MSEWFKFFTNKDYKKVREQTFNLIHNREKINKMVAYNNKLHSDTMKILRELKTPQYDAAFVLRGKKGFNTIGFNLTYDIMMCDHNGKIIKLFNEVPVGYISDYYQESHYIYFMTTGSINFYKLNVKDIVTLGRKW